MNTNPTRLLGIGFDPIPAFIVILLTAVIIWLVVANSNHESTVIWSATVRTVTNATTTLTASYRDSTDWQAYSNDFTIGDELRVSHAGRTVLVRVVSKGPRDIPGRPDVYHRLDLSKPAWVALEPDARLGLIECEVRVE